MLIVIFNILGFLVLFGSVVPIVLMFSKYEVFLTYWPNTDPDTFWIGLVVALVLLGMARIMAELQDIKEKLDRPEEK